MLILDFQLATTSWSPDMHVQDRQMDCNLQWHLARTRRFHDKASKQLQSQADLTSQQTKILCSTDMFTPLLDQQERLHSAPYA